MNTFNNSQSLPRSEKLKSRALIQKLFDEGKSIFNFPLKLVYLKINNQQQLTESFLFSVSVPKRNHKLAVTRNLLKRRIRSAYRKNKPLIPNDSPTTNRYALMYILVDKKISNSELIVHSMKKLNDKLTRILSD